MTLREVDEQLARWQDKQRLIGDNLKSFVDLPAFQRLCGQGAASASSFIGETQKRIAAALDVLRGLYEQQTLLRQTLGQAEALHASISRLRPSRQTLQEIEHILCGPSIELASSPTPPERRELLRDVTQAVRVSPDRLLEIMLDSFRFVRDTVLGVATAEENLAATLDAQRLELARLHGIAHSLGTAASTELANVAQLHSDLMALADLDPLAAEAGGSSLPTLLQTVACSLDGAIRRQRDVNARLTDGKSLIVRLREMHERARKAVAEQELKVQMTGDPSARTPSGDDELAALEAWFIRLQRTVEKGEHGPAEVGLRKWTDAAVTLLTAEQTALERAESALRARRDLRGLFEALEAKAFQCGRVEDPQLAPLGQEVKRLLRSRPTPLTQAQELVSRYEERLL